jgi:hypothetical protein
VTVINGGSGGGGGGPSVITASVAPSGGDDTAAIQSAINGAVTAGQANGSNYAEVWFAGGVYSIAGAPGGHGTPTFANSQITLPLIPSGTSTGKFTLVLRSTRSSTALPHWNQTVGQRSGAVLRSTATGTNDVTYGPASIIGGPTALQGYGGGTGNAWSNMLIVIDGLSLMSATGNPTMCGFNFEGLLEAHVISGAYMADASPSVMAGFIASGAATFTNQWAYGLMMPTTNNNDLSVIDDWSCEGAWYGAVFGEHTHVRDIRCIYCGWGWSLDNRTATPHVGHVDYASVEICNNIMGLYAATAAQYKCDFDLIDIESVLGGGIWDGNSAICGNVIVGANTAAGRAGTVASANLSNWIGNWNSTPTNGQNMHVIHRDALPGAVAAGNAPTIPAASADRYNGLMRDCLVNIAGGTGVSVSVDGQATGMAPPCTVFVGAGKRINLGAYTGAPTWNWVAL